MSEKAFHRLLALTERMDETLRAENLRGFGVALEKRRQLLQKLLAVKRPRTEEERAYLSRTIELDGQVTCAARRLETKYRQDIDRFERKAENLFQYEKSRYDLSQGQLMDTKR